MKTKHPHYCRYALFFRIPLLWFFIVVFTVSCNKKELSRVEAADNVDLSALRVNKPNIILVMGDDIGYEVPTVNGGQSYETPNIDLLARKGMRFTQCHSSPFCAPSRWMLLTGKYNFRNFESYGILGTDQRTIANMLHDHGYTTAVYGKWALDGGATSIGIFGFDQYTIWNPYKDFEGDQRNKGSHYRDPQIYENGIFVADSLTKDKYGDDIFTDSLLNFISANKRNPFFAYFPMTLCHIPFFPTPDDPEFLTFKPKDRTTLEDTVWYPNMIKYTDKLIGKIVTHVKNEGLANETAIIIVLGDNGCPQGIRSYFNGTIIEGGRQSHKENGTHVALFVYWPGRVTGGTVNDDLIDFTDFLPTIAGIAGVPLPTTFGPLDGISFAPRLLGEPGTPREWIFNHYQPFPDIPGSQLYRWVQNKTYKLYDTSSTKQGGRFYNIAEDVNEEQPIPRFMMTPEEKAIRNQFADVMASMHE